MEWSAIVTGAGVLAMVIINTIVIIRSRNRIIEEKAEKRGITSANIDRFRNDIAHLSNTLAAISDQIKELQVNQASAFSTLIEQVKGHEVRITRLEDGRT